MVFASFEFLFGLLPLTLIAYHGCRGRPAAAKLVLIAASMVFYAWTALHFLPLILASVAVNYTLGAALARRRSRALFYGGLAFNLALLGWFKYGAFAGANLAALAGEPFFVQAVVLPLAISFFTFQQIAYLTETYRGAPAAGSAADYALFILFFPHLVAGPITLHTEMLPQFARTGTGRIPRATLVMGAAILILGLAKKTLLADPLATLADPVFAAAAAGHAIGTAQAWQAALGYTFQLYFDFSGYSDMAIGIGLLFGIRFPVNFASPYRATSIIDFWQRWHITLGRFLRAYVYIPLGGNRGQRSRNLMLTMLAGGLWHGAGWTFIAWGALHGAYLVVNHAWRARARGPASPAARVAGWALTFVAVTVGWVVFRAASLGAAGAVLWAMAGHDGGVAIATPGPLIAAAMLAVAAAIAFLAPNALTIAGYADAPARNRRAHAGLAAEGLAAAGLGVVAALCFARLPASGVFLYFSF